MWNDWPSLLAEEQRPLLEALAEAPVIDAALIERMRTRWTQPVVAAAIELVNGRRKAAKKLLYADRLLCDATGVEQATSFDVADHKARRFAESNIDYVTDLCCGIGGDAMALAQRMSATIVDQSPARIRMAAHNVKLVTDHPAPAHVADAADFDVKGKAVHIDPDRRASGRRSWKLADVQPGAARLAHIVELADCCAIKLPPGVDYDELAELLDCEYDVEIISRNRRLVQAVVWTGRLRRDLRTATCFPQGATLHGSVRKIPLTLTGAYLHSVDPAVERAELIGELCRQLEAAAIHPALGLLTSNEPIDSPWLVSFEVLEQMPWRLKKVKSWLRSHGGGKVEVKTRDGAVDPDVVSRQLRGNGHRRFTVFILRKEEKVVAWITQRVEPREDTMFLPLVGQ